MTNGSTAVPGPNSPGTRSFIVRTGPRDGNPVTLIHGFPTSSHDWSLVLPSLVAAGFRVTTLDLLGFGASSKPKDHEYRIVEQADLVETLWAELGITETALVAHDYGVSVAQELLARNPQRVTRMVWMNGGLYPDLHRPLLVQKLLLGPLGGLIARVSSEFTLRMNMDKILGRKLPASDLHQLWLAMSSHGGKEVMHSLVQYIPERRRNAERWQQALETYPGPTMFIWGPADPISGGHVLPRLRERMPSAKFVVLDEEPPVSVTIRSSKTGASCRRSDRISDCVNLESRCDRERICPDRPPERPSLCADGGCPQRSRLE